MREILFKAKRVDNGEWVYGSYAKAQRFHDDNDDHCIIEYERNGRTYGCYSNN